MTKTFDNPSATFIYKGTEVEFQMSISGESLFEPPVSEWLKFFDKFAKLLETEILAFQERESKL